jgi:dTDP-4-amino-4,6-dideoxygalactose transaminase
MFQMADMDAILPTAQEFGLKVIEDSCEVLGRNTKDGSGFALITVYSVFIRMTNNNRRRGIKSLKMTRMLP